jgi:hypothetical protein
MKRGGRVVPTRDFSSVEVGARMGPHEEFLELAALAAGGALSPDERKKLDEHLATCIGCQEAQRDFETVIDQTLPALTLFASPESGAQLSFSEERAEAAFRKRLEQDQKPNPISSPVTQQRKSPRRQEFRRAFDRFHFYMPFAAAIFLCISLGILTYRMGTRHGSTRFAERSEHAHTDSEEPELRVAQERLAQLNRELGEHETALAKLRHDLAASAGENAKLKSLQAEQQTALALSAGKEKQWNDERGRLTEELAASHDALADSQKKLQGLEGRSGEDATHALTLEARAADLSRSLADEQRMNEELQDLLAKDRDIRDLMGARDLYIAEVHDILTTGETRKAFGRVFYTKGKSLVFYAYDLTDLPGLKAASTFQVWGNRGPDRAQAVKLGMFYEDNLSKKRWVMKFNDKRTLDQIDAVFVTIEPSGGSVKPSGLPLMYAYLKVDANHP